MTKLVLHICHRAGRFSCKKKKKKHLHELAVLQTEVIRFLTHEKAPKMPLKPL